MTKSAEQLLVQAMQLGEEDREELADRLLETLEVSNDPEYLAAWESEIKKRIESHERGEDDGIPWEVAIKQILAGEGDDEEAVILDRQARTDVAKAYKWYRRESLKVATRFIEEVNQGLMDIKEGQIAYPKYLHETRRCLLRKFPYLIVFKEYADHFFVVAVAHGHRKPGYWRRRIY